MNIRFMICGLLFLLASCGKGIETTETDNKCDSTLTFSKDIEPMVAKTGTAHCASCHAGKYDSLSGLSKDQGDVYQEVRNGKMPQGNSGFKDTPDGKKMLDWLGCKNLK